MNRFPIVLRVNAENSPAQTRTPEQTAQQAVTYARDHLFEKDAVQDRRALYETALNRGMGEITHGQVRLEFERRMQAGEFREAQASVRGPQITTAQMVRMEREIVGQMQQGNRRGYDDPMLLQGRERFDTLERHPELNRSQQEAAREVFASREKIVGIDGVAGAGKTTPLAVIREGAEAEGYRVEGFAPTSRAQPRSSVRPALRLQPCRCTWRDGRGRTPERSGSMCSMSLHSRPPSRCTSL